MKRFLGIATIFVSLSLTAQLTATTYQMASSEKSGNLIFLYNEVFGFTEKKGDKVEGLLVDVMVEFEKYMLKNEGIRLTHEFVYQENSFAGFMNQVKNASGGVFGLGNVSIKEERKNNYSFSPPFLSNVSLLVTHNKVKSLSSKSDISEQFKEMKGYSISSTTTDERMRRIKSEYLPSLEIEYLDSGNELIDKISQNNTTFAILDLNFYLESLYKRKPIKRHGVFDKSDEPFGIVMPKNSGWSKKLEEFFNSGFIESSEYSQIISDNLGNSALGLIKSARSQ